MTDSQGNVISRRDFLPFGEQLDPDVGGRSSITAYQPENDNVKQKFTGYHKDEESGLDFAEARMYENRHGRFTAVDPLLASGKSANPQTFNRFVYVGNNPIILTDPSGLIWYYNAKIKRYNWFDEESGKFTYDDGDASKNGLTDDWKLVKDCVGEGCFLHDNEIGGWTAHDPASATYSTWALFTQAKWEYGSYTNYQGSGNIPIYGTFFLPMLSGIKTGNFERASYGFAGTAASLATLPRTTVGLLKEGATEGFSYVTNLPWLNPKNLFSRRSADAVEDTAETVFEQYSLRARRDGVYPVMRRGSKEPVGEIFLNKGDVWKFGETKNPGTRYTQKWLKESGLEYTTEFKTPSFKDVLQTERQKIVEYETQFGNLPPGNKIRK